MLLDPMQCILIIQSTVRRHGAPKLLELRNLRAQVFVQNLKIAGGVLNTLNMLVLMIDII